MFLLSMHVTISFSKYLIYHYLMFRRVCVGEHAGLHIFCVLTHKPPALKSYIHFYSQAKPWPLYFPCIPLNSLPLCLALLFPNGHSLCYSVQILLTFSYSTLKSVLSESIPCSYHPEVMILALTANNTSSLCLFKNVFYILSINF